MAKHVNMGSVSTATMREEDLIPTFLWELEHQKPLRKEHKQLIRDIQARMESDDYFESEDAGFDLNEGLLDALNEYAPPYFYFGSHPGDGADYGYWLSEEWDAEFISVSDLDEPADKAAIKSGVCLSLKVSDLIEVPKWYSGEVAVINDHGNVTLYRKGRNGQYYEIWSVV